MRVMWINTPTKQQLLKALIVLILITLIINGYTFLLFLKGSAGSQGGEIIGGGGSDGYDLWDETYASAIIRNKSIPSIRFKTCDTDDKLVILAGIDTVPGLVQIAQRIRLKYLQLQNEGRNTGIVPPSVTRLQRILFQPSDSVNNSKKKTKNSFSTNAIWSSVREWPFSDSLRLFSLGQVLSTTAKAGIRNAIKANRGTQLKVEMILDGGQTVLWKPEAYPRNSVLQLEGFVYGGRDRHFGEIAAFYLNLLLGYNNAPITTGRRINLEKELWPVSSSTLKETFFTNAKGSVCFFGVCHFCAKKDAICQKSTSQEVEGVEGAMILWMQKKFRTVPNPWRRTSYTANVPPAPWEISMDFCNQLMRDVPRINRVQMILDIVGASIFDFLIGNGDRHHLEMLHKTEPDYSSHSSKLILLDNGKSFGNPVEDYVDILAPLFQCCKIRKSLYITLNRFEGKLGSWLDLITKGDPLYPLLTKEHLVAVDRRLTIVLATINYCKDTVQRHNTKHNQNEQKKLFYDRI